MKQWMVFLMLCALGAAALIRSEQRRPEVAIGPNALLSFIADSERELSQLPVSVARLSDQEEIEIGDHLAAIYAAHLSNSSADPDTQRYIQQVGTMVSGRAHRRLPYKFHYVADPQFVNAFALPGGHVFIGKGMIDLMDSEDQLAGVLGHETEHVDHYHSAARLILEVRLRKLHLGVAGTLAAIPIHVFMAGYSKQQELEADREGARLAVMAGYSPWGMVRMMETFERLRPSQNRNPASPQQEIAEISWKTLRGYFQSHPDPKERIAQLHAIIAQEKWTDRTNERALRMGGRAARASGETR